MDMKAVFLLLMFILGACFGSFLCCQARRMEIKRTAKKKKDLGKRSVCLHCGYRLKWYDNIPIFSWLVLKGKCRKCHKKIGIAEIIAEVLTGLAFLMIGTTLDIDWMSTYGTTHFIITTVFLIAVVFLAIYDGMYGLLPTTWLIVAMVIGLIKVIALNIVVGVLDGFDPSLIYMPLAAVAILGGVYLILYKVSKGKWVGEGDWILGVAIGLSLMHPWLALITLFLANVIACGVMAPIVYKKNKNSTSKKKTSVGETQIYFGPFMVIGFVIAYTFSEFFFYALSGFYM